MEASQRDKIRKKMAALGWTLSIKVWFNPKTKRMTATCRATKGDLKEASTSVDRLWAKIKEIEKDNFNV